jgi:hypothetical protein
VERSEIDEGNRVNAIAEDLARTLSRVAELDEEAVRAELELRFRDPHDVETGLAEWRRIKRRTLPSPPTRRDLD